MPAVPRMRAVAAALACCAVVFAAAAAEERAGRSLADLPRWTAEAQSQPPLSDAQRTLLGEARAALDDGQLIVAAQTLDQLREGSARDNFEVNFLLARVNDAFQFPGEARTAVLRALRSRPDDVRANVLAARLLLPDDPDRAIRHLRAATLADDSQASLAETTLAWRLLAEAAEHQGYTRAACEAWHNFDLAIWETFPEHRNAPQIADYLRVHPRGGFSHRLRLLKQLGETEARADLVSDALRRDPHDPELLRLRVETLLAASREAEAFRFARAQLEADGDQGTLLSATVTAAERAGALSVWVDDLAADLPRAAGQARAHAVLKELNRRGLAEPARGLARQLVEREPSDVDAAVGLFVATAGDKPLEAVQILTRMFRADATLYVAPRLLEDVQRGLAEPLRNFDLLELTAAEPDDAATRLVHGLLLAGRGDQAGALERYAAARAAEPDLSLARLLEGEAELASYRWEAALAIAEELLESHPRLGSASYLQARALSGLDRNEEARTALRQAMHRDEQEPAYPLAFGDLCQRLADYRCAQRYYREAFTLAAGDAAFEGLIEAYLRAGQRNLAEQEASRLADEAISEAARRRVRTMIRYLDQPFSDVHLKALAEQLAQHPEDVVTIRMYAAGLMTNGYGEQALQWLEYASSLAPDDDELTIELSQMYRLRVRFEEAADTLAPLVERYPNRVPVLARYSTDLLASFEIDRGLDTLEHVAELEADETENALRYRQLLVMCLEFGRHERGARILEQIRTAQAEAGEDTAELEADYLIAMGREGAAYEIIRDWYEQAPTDPLRRERLFNAAVRMQDYDAIAARIENWIAAGESPASWTDRLIGVRLVQENFDAARKVAESFEGGLNEQNARRVWLGQIAIASGDLELGEREFQSLIDERMVEDEWKANAWAQWIDSLTRRGAYDEALRICDRWHETWPSLWPIIRRARLGVLQTAGRDLEQIPLLEEDYSTRAGEAGLNNDLGYTWADNGLHLDQAEAMIRYATALDPVNAAYLDSLGWVLYKQGRLSEARLWLDRACRLRAGRDATLQDHFGDVLWRLHERDAALDAWRCALQLLDEIEQPGPRDLRLRQNLRNKLDAVRHDEPPSLAPLGEEQR